MKITKDEMRCPCCDKEWTDEEFYSRINRARNISGVSYLINSGCRCIEHNKSVGGVETSSHLIGCAADIKATNNHSRFMILYGLILAGFSRIHIGDNFIHVDSDRNKTQEVIWR